MQPEMGNLVEELDNLAVAGSGVALQYAWLSVKFLSEEAKLSNADELSGSALSWAIEELYTRHSAVLSRKQVADRLRIGRFYPKDYYDELCSELGKVFSFSELRAAMDNDPAKSRELLDQCVKEGLTPEQIYQLKTNKENVSDVDKAWNRIVSSAKKFIALYGDDSRASFLYDLVKYNRVAREKP